MRTGNVGSITTESRRPDERLGTTRGRILQQVGSPDQRRAQGPGANVAHADRTIRIARPRSRRLHTLCDNFNDEAVPNRHPWAGNTVFANPAFLIAGKAAERAYLECINNQVLSYLVLPSSINAEWFHRFAAHADLRFPAGRWQFEPPPGIAPSTARGDVLLAVFSPETIAKAGPRVVLCNALGRPRRWPAAVARR